jgi:hypothetical protein
MSTKLTIRPSESNVRRARQCLAMIRDIAGRGALAQDPEHVGYALQELSQVLLERTGTEDRYFEPISATLIGGLEKLYEELDFVNGTSQDCARNDANRNYGQWN